MFKLKELTADTITPDETKRCQMLFDYLLGHEETFLEEKRLSEHVDKEHPLLINQMFKDRDQIRQNNRHLIFALEILIQQINFNWTIENKTKLIKAIVNTSNEQLITYQPNSAQEDHRLANSFTNYIKKRDSANQGHKKLKASISI